MAASLDDHPTLPRWTLAVPAGAVVALTSLNLALGSAMASIGLTIAAVVVGTLTVIPDGRRRCRAACTSRCSRPSCSSP